MAVTATAALSAAARAAVGLLCCLPVVVGGWLVPDHPLVSAATLVTVVVVVAAAAVRRRRLEAAALALALLLVFLGALGDAATIRSEEELHGVRYGLPLDWVVVEHHLSPGVFPYTTGWSPWEDPASAEGAPFALDWLLVTVPLVAAALVLRRRVSSAA